MIDTDMRQLANTKAPVGVALPPARTTEAIRQVLETRQTLVTDFQPRLVSGKTQFTILTPVNLSSEVRYVLSYAPRPDAIQSIVTETYRPDGWLAAVLDRNGTIIARSVGYDEFFGRPANPDFVKRISPISGSTQSVDLQGRESITAWRTTRDGWKVLVWAPKEVLSQRSRIAVGALGLIALAVLLTSVLASWFASRLIRGPAQRLVHAAHSLGEGQLVHFAPTPMKEANAIGASLSEASDVIQRRESDLRASQAHMTLVMRELSHRSKNLLAMVQALARQSARAASSYEDFQARFLERLHSLSMSHDLLVKTDWTSVPLRVLAEEQLRVFVDKPGERIVMSGEDLLLKPEAAQNLGMAFHELGSNAVKHGALSSPGGSVTIEWRIENPEEPTLVLCWRERGGPPVRPPTTRGFGAVMLQRLIPQSLQGEATTAWEEPGYEWTLRAPMSSIARLTSYIPAQRAS